MTLWMLCDEWKSKDFVIILDMLKNYGLLKHKLVVCRFTRDVGGYAFLYADIFMSRAEFEEMFDLTLYEKVRENYHANGAFPHLYDKVSPEIDVFEVGKQYIDPL